MKSSAILFSALCLSALPASASLVAQWSFDEGGGTVISNTANPAFPGTLAGGAGFTAGPQGFGTAFSGDGLDDQMNTSFSGIAGGLPRTVTAWIRYPNQPSAAPNEFDAIVSYGNNSPNGSRWSMRVSDTAAVVPYRLRLEVAGGGIYGNTSLNDDLWHHVAVVQTGNTLGSVLLYVDGQPETLAYNGAGATLAINTSTVAASPTNVTIGGSPHSVSYNFLGAIDEVRLYDSVLTQTEIQGLMVPEPATGTLALAALGLLARRRRC